MAVDIVIAFVDEISNPRSPPLGFPLDQPAPGRPSMKLAVTVAVAVAVAVDVVVAVAVDPGETRVGGLRTWVIAAGPKMVSTKSPTRGSEGGGEVTVVVAGSAVSLKRDEMDEMAMPVRPNSDGDLAAAGDATEGGSATKSAALKTANAGFPPERTHFWKYIW